MRSTALANEAEVRRKLPSLRLRTGVAMELGEWRPAVERYYIAESVGLPMVLLLLAGAIDKFHDERDKSRVRRMRDWLAISSQRGRCAVDEEVRCARLVRWGALVSVLKKDGVVC